MPLYEYHCEACDYEFSDVLPIAERDAPTNEACPRCLRDHVKRGIASARIVAGVGDFRSKLPDVFKDRLREIKKQAGSRSTIDV